MTELDRPHLERIQEALEPHVHRTPLWPSATLSRLSGCNVFLKAELLQKTGSYKVRGMLWALHALTPEQRARGVITFSAGNAAQGLAYAARLHGVPATVVMPGHATLAKASATRDYGAEVILHGNVAEARALCAELVEQRHLTYLSPYDDLEVMRGNASLGGEIFEALPEVDAIVLGVGGGGMLGGLSMAIEACGSSATLIGVEPEGAASMYRSFASGHAVMLDAVSTIADGLAAPGAGVLCYERAKPHTREIALVSDEEIVQAMRFLLERCKLMAEPAGAASTAALLSGRLPLTKGSNIVVLVSGGNVDLSRLKSLL